MEQTAKSKSSMLKAICYILTGIALICFAIGVLGASSCTTTKKGVYKTDSTASNKSVSEVIEAITNKAEESNEKETISTTTWDDAFWTDSSKSTFSLNPSDSTHDGLETDDFKVTATKNKNGGIDVNLVQKPKRAYGKASNTTVTKEKSDSKSETEIKSKETSKEENTTSIETVTKSKDKEGTHPLMKFLWAVIGVAVLYAIVMYFYNKYKNKLKL